MDVRDTVLAAALQIIATDGPDAVSMREVARRSGVSHQAPYHHFGDRAGIFAAITEAGFEMLAEKFAAVLTNDTAPARHCFEAYVSMAVENPAHFRVMFRRDICGLASHDSARAAGDAAYAELLKMVERTIGRPAGERESVTWATLMWSSAHGLATLLVDGPLESKLPEGVSVADHIDDVVSLMTEMVEKQAASMGLTPVR
jgi:AcrR family transcriptional regulator